MGMIRGAASLLVVPIGSTQDYEGDVPGNGIVQENGLVWLLLDGATIGNGSSGATRYATDKARELFKRLWSNSNLAIFTNTGAGSTRGATADTDFDASKRLALPDPRGRTIIPAGQSSGLTSRTRGQTGGAETHTLSTSEMPSHNHYAQNYRTFREAAGYGLTSSVGYVFGDRIMVWTESTESWSEAASSVVGGGNSHNIMQPFYVTSGRLILAGRV